MAKGGDSGFEFPEPGNGWYDERANLAGRVDSAWTPNWAQETAFPPYGTTEIQTVDPNPPASVSGVLSQAALAGGANYDVPAETDQALWGQGGGLGNPAQMSPNTFLETDNPGAVDWYLTGSTPGSNPSGGGANAPAVEWNVGAAPSGNQADDLNVAPKPYGLTGGQDEEPDIGLSALASQAPGPASGSGVSGITDLPGVSGADDLNASPRVFSN